MTEFNWEAGERELGEALGSEEPASPAFRAGLRESFLAGVVTRPAGLFSESGSQSPGDMRSGDGMSPVEDYLIENDPLEAPDAVFRAEARKRFLAGESVGRSSGPGMRLLTRPTFVLGLGLAAAALLIFFLRPPSRATPEAVGGWVVAHLDGEGPIRVDGRDVELAELGPMLDGAQHIETVANRIRLTWQGELVIELAAGTALKTVAFVPGEGESFDFDLPNGELLVRTSKAYASGPLTFHTADLDVRVTGTTLGIEAMDGFTCVCVCEGSVEILDSTGEICDVGSKRSYMAMPDGTRRQLAFADLPKAHTAPLLALHAMIGGSLFR